METKRTGNKHRGQLVKRFRESIGMKQATLADELGTTQQNISYYEKQEELDDIIFADLAKAMGISPEILDDFVAGSEVYNIQEMNDQSAIMKDSPVYNPVYNFNPIDKIVEQSSKIEELYKELLESERDKIKILSDAYEALQKMKKG